MKVLVTGGRGLLGGGVVEELVRRGHEVTVFQRHSAGARPGVAEALGDVRDAEAVAAATAGQDAIIHLAAKVDISGPWRDFEDVNVMGTSNVLAAAQRHAVRRLVHISSPSVAHSGRSLVGAAAGVADPATAHGHYARSKAIAERLLTERTPEDVHLSVLRPHLVWGPGDEQLVERIAERGRNGRLFLIGGGRTLIDTLYIDNAGPAVAQALERCHLPGVDRTPLVVTNGEPRPIGELVERIAAALGVPGPRASIPKPVAAAAGWLVDAAWSRLPLEGEPPLTSFLVEQLSTAHWFDQRATQAALAWRPEVTIDEGLARLASGSGDLD